MAQTPEKLAMALLTGQVRDMSALAVDPELESSVFYGEQSPWDDYSGEALPALDPIDLSVAGDAIAAGQAVTNRDPLALALAALSVGLPGTIRPVSGLQAYAEVLPKSVRLAQMRVVEPLGGIGTDAAEVAISDIAREAAAKRALDMSAEARLARAAEQGYLPETFYHGTIGDVAAFDPSLFGRGPYSMGDPGLMGRGVYLTNDPYLAAQYPHKQGVAGRNVMPLRVKDVGLYDMDADPLLVAHKRGADIEAALNSAGYGGVRRTLRGGADKMEELVLYDPAAIRSVFAAFDPAKSDISDLLASYAPPLLLGGSLASLEDEE